MPPGEPPAFSPLAALMPAGGATPAQCLNPSSQQAIRQSTIRLTTRRKQTNRQAPIVSDKHFAGSSTFRRKLRVKFPETPSPETGAGKVHKQETEKKRRHSRESAAKTCEKAALVIEFGSILFIFLEGGALPLTGIAKLFALALRLIASWLR